MKKILLMVALVVSSVTVMAQKRAIGGRANNGVEVSYQHQMGDANMIEVDAGLWALGHESGFTLFGLYDWIMPINTFEDGSQMNWYAGVGAGVGSWTDKEGKFNNLSRDWETYSYVNLCVAGQVGIEYTFKFPLQLSLDIRPTLGMDLGDENKAYFDVFQRGALSLGVRYRF